MSVCLFVCPLVFLKTHMSRFDHIFCTCYLWPFLITFIDGSFMGMFSPLCSVLLDNISKTDAAGITILDTEMFRDEC